MYMREYWFQVQKSPVVYRYIDWSITVPLQMIEFNLTLKAAGKPVGSMMLWRLLGGTMAMLAFKYAGEVGAINAWIGLAIDMSGCAFILFELFEEGNTSLECSDAVRTSFNSMRIIVYVGWAIYPLGYLFGTLTSAADPKLLNVIYNVADFVNEICFVLSYWTCVKALKVEDHLYCNDRGHRLLLR